MIKVVRVTPEMATEWFQGSESRVFGVDEGGYLITALTEESSEAVALSSSEQDSNALFQGEKESPSGFPAWLRHRGVHHYSTVAAVTLLIWKHETGKRGIGSVEELEPIWSKYQHQILEALPMGLSFRGSRGEEKGALIPPAIVSFCMWIFAKTSAEDAEFFFKGVRDGLGILPSSPIYALRQAALANQIPTVRKDAIAYIIEMWNLFQKSKDKSIRKNAN